MKRILVLLATFALPAFAQDLIVNVNLTMLSLAAEDGDGHPVLNLTADDFEIIENGQSRPVTHFVLEDAPVAIGLLVDRSISIKPVRKNLDETVTRLLDETYPPDQVFLVTFAGTNKLKVGLTTDRTEILKALEKTKLDFGTRFYDAVIDSLQYLSWSKLDHKTLVVLSDGADHYSSRTFLETAEAARALGYDIYIIGYTGDDSRTWTGAGRRQIREEFEQLAGITGGKAFFPRSRTEFAAIAKQILDASRYKYRLGFYSSGPLIEPSQIQVNVRDPESKRISIRVSRPDYSAAP